MTERRLLWHGALLFLLGLLNGAAIPAFTNPRLALSAHLGDVQDGMVLMILGLAWPRLTFTPRAETFTFGLALLSMYGLWVGLLLGAALGTSEATPIAGAGHHGTPGAEALVQVILTIGAIAAIGAMTGVLWELRRDPR